jgi:radical SAM superfamily enzyme YgiQ (UPF0313 family)
LHGEGCYFCGRTDSGLRYKQPSRYIAELRSIMATHDVKQFFDVGDDFASNVRWLRDLIAVKETLCPRIAFPMKALGRAGFGPPTVCFRQT